MSVSNATTHEPTSTDEIHVETASPQCEAVPPTAKSSPKQGSARRLLIALILLTVVLYGRGLTHSSGYYGDSFHHLLNGIFVHDAMHDPAESLADPIGFALNYYMHYPAVNLGYYPPVFPIIEAVLMTIFGVSAMTGQLAVFLMAVLLTLFSFAWFRLRFDPWWAATATALLISTPLLVYWGRDIMLEVPMLALVMGSIWSFERLVRTDRPTWSASMTWALLTILAIWTKQHALMVLGIFVVCTVASHRWKHLTRPSVLVATLLIAIAAAGLIKLQLSLGGDAVEDSIGTSTTQMVYRFNIRQWTSYPLVLPSIVGWPALLLAPFGLFYVFKKREQYASIILAWLIIFYIMHSYFTAQNIRYAVLWIPPFCALAVIGLRHLTLDVRLLRERHWIGTLLTGAIVGLSIFWAVQIDVPRVPSAYQRAAEDLADRMGPFSCVSFLSDRPGRPAVCYRLAVEERQTKELSLYSFGRLLRATQLYAASKDRWPTLHVAAADLKRWNVKYILTEQPRELSRSDYGEEVAEIVDGVLAFGEFQILRTYPVHYPSSQIPKRTLMLFE